MTERRNDDLMLNELKHLRGDISKLDRRMEGMETTMAAVALQSNQISAVCERVTKLEKWNTEQAKELKDVAKFQGGCVRFTFDKVVEKQWTAIKLLAGAMLTGFGVLGAFIRWAG